MDCDSACKGVSQAMESENLGSFHELERSIERLRYNRPGLYQSAEQFLAALLIPLLSWLALAYCAL